MPERSNSNTQMITTSVTAATSRLVQLMPRLTHQSSAQLMITGTMISNRNGLSVIPSQRPPLEVPAPMPTAPPIGTLDFDKTRTIRRAGVTGASPLQRKLPA
jgi:hypothetical protein